MTVNSLRRWCKPRMILVISNRSENPAHTLEVVTRLRATRAKIFLVQLPGPVNTMRGPVHDLPSLVTDTQTTSDGHSMYGTRQAFLWAEILSEVTVVKNTPIERIPAFANSLAAKVVVFTTPAVGLIRFRAGNGFETDLFASLGGADPHFQCPHQYEWVERQGIPQNSSADHIWTRSGIPTAIRVPICTAISRTRNGVARIRKPRNGRATLGANARRGRSKASYHRVKARRNSMSDGNHGMRGIPRQADSQFP